jgi:hypothetical protein
MNIFEGGPLEHQVMEKAGCMEYSVTAWEPVRDDVYQRQVHYKFDKKSARHGAEAMSTQHKSPLPDKNEWLVEEVLTLEGIPVGEYFNIRVICVIFLFFVHFNISVAYCFKREHGF